MKLLLSLLLLIQPARVLFWTGNIADYTVTRVVLRQGGREGNPLLPKSAVGMAGYMFGSAAFIDVMTQKTVKTHPKATKRLRTILGVMHWSLAGWGIHELRKR